MIFIPNNVPSLKNSKQLGKSKPKYICPACKQGVGQRPIVLFSKTVKKYLQKIGVKKYSAKGYVEEYATRENLFRKAVGDYFDGCQKPVVVKFFFVRGSKHKFDIINAMQIICDLLVAHGYIVDDNADYLIPMPMKSDGVWYGYDKENPGVWLKIVRDEG